MEKNSKKVLIIEDEPALVKIISEKLSYAGFNPVVAMDGEEGIEKALAERPDLIILDLVLPKKDGLIVMKNLRENEWGKTVPIIILTNLSADSRITARVIKDEPSYYLTKTDWPLDDVIQKVKEAIGDGKK